MQGTGCKLNRIASAQVAILCNHQRAVPKGHSGQMDKLEARLLELQAELDALSADYRAAQRAKNAAKAESCAPSLACFASSYLLRRSPPSAARTLPRPRRACCCNACLGAFF